MTAYLYPQENALDFGFEVFAEGKRGETNRQSQKVRKKNVLWVEEATVVWELLGKLSVTKTQSQPRTSPLSIYFPLYLFLCSPDAELKQEEFGRTPHPSLLGSQL